MGVMDYANALLGGGSLTDLSTNPNFINPSYATPQQLQAQILLGQQTMKNQQQVHRPAQGFANLANSFIGGYEQGDAGLQQQQAQQNYGALQAAFDRQQQRGAGAQAVGSDMPGAAPSDVSNYVASAATARGIDPNTALAAFGAESKLNPSAAGDLDANGKPTSFGVAQLHYAGAPGGPNSSPGLGDEFTKTTGLDARDPATTKKQIEFALDKVAAGGWGPWHAAQKLGIGNRDGLGVPPTALALTGGQMPSVSPANMAIANALQQPNAGQAPKNAPDPNLLAALLSNPWTPDAVKANLAEYLKPQVLRGAMGENVGYTPVQGGRTTGLTRGYVPGQITLPGGTSAPVGTTSDGQGNVKSTLAIPGSTGAAPLGSLPSLAKAATEVQTQNDATRTAGGASATQFANDRSGAANYGRTILPLTQAIPALQRLGQTGTGPGTDQRNQIVSFLQSLGIPGFDGSKVKDFDEANKYLTEYVRQSGSSGTNDQLAAAFAGNPSTKISNAAAVDVAKTALTQQRMRQAMILSSDQNHPENYSDYAQKYATQIDPRAFGTDLMSPAALAALDKSLPKGSPERARFLQSARIAKQSGVMTPLPSQ